MAKEAKEKQPPVATNAERFAAFMDMLAANGTVSPDVAGIVKHAIAHHAAKLNS